MELCTIQPETASHDWAAPVAARSDGGVAGWSPAGSAGGFCSGFWIGDFYA